MAKANPTEKGCSVPHSHNASMLPRRALIACAVAALCFFVNGRPAWAEPSSQELAQQREGLEAELAEAQERLDQLEAEADEALQELEESKQKLEETRSEVNETKAQIDETTQELEEKREELGMSMRNSYKIGPLRIMDILLGAKSYEDLVSRIYYLDKVDEARAEEIQEVNDLADDLSVQLQELEEVQARLQTDVESFEERATEYEERIMEAHDYRDGLSEDVQRVLEEEEAARAAEEAARKAAEEAARKAAEEAAHEASDSAEDEKAADSKDNSETTSAHTAQQTVNVSVPANSTSADQLIYIQWGGRPQVCWPVQGGSMSQKIECGSETLVMAAILLTGDYSITPDSLFAAMEAKYGPISASQTYNYILRYIEEEYGVHHRSVSHLSADEARAILAQGHVISAGGGCEGRDGLPFCKAVGARPRCSHGHVVLFYKYEDGIFWAKDSAPSDGAAMCAYPDGPLTITHHGAAGGRCRHNGETATYDNYADAFLRNSWNVELWVD